MISCNCGSDGSGNGQFWQSTQPPPLGSDSVSSLTVRRFSNLIPFTSSNNTKFNAATTALSGSLNEFSLDAYPLYNEIVRGDIHWTNLGNTVPINLTFTWTNLITGENFFVWNFTIPTPASQGFGYWAYYDVRSWVGNSRSWDTLGVEIDIPGSYRLTVTSDTSQAGFNSQSFIFTATRQEVSVRTEIINDGNASADFALKTFSEVEGHTVLDPIIVDNFNLNPGQTHVFVENFLPEQSGDYTYRGAVVDITDTQQYDDDLVSWRLD